MHEWSAEPAAYVAAYIVCVERPVCCSGILDRGPELGISCLDLGGVILDLLYFDAWHLGRGGGDRRRMIRHYLRANEQKYFLAETVPSLPCSMILSSALRPLMIAAILRLLQLSRQNSALSTEAVCLAVITTSTDVVLFTAVATLEQPVAVTDVLNRLDVSTAVGDRLGGTSRHSRDEPRGSPGPNPGGPHWSHLKKD
jgi:hypothetical protein